MKPHTRPIFVCGYPSDVGGANTELWHTVKLWRRAGQSVVMIPTWQASPLWRERLGRIGAATVHATPDTLAGVKGLPGSIVVSFCNPHFLSHAAAFRSLDCRIVWVGCMNFLQARERLHYQNHGAFDAYIFQSRYQRSKLEPELTRWGYSPAHGHLIRGAFDLAEYPFRPLAHRPGDTFVVGRISRPEPDKFRRGMWQALAAVNQNHPLKVRVLGWSAKVERELGRPPRWAECLPPGTLPSRRLLSGLHALVQLGQQAVENWPRVGLEAMAAGVPIIAENRGGWPEMIEDRETGFLVDGWEEVLFRISLLAQNERLRLATVEAARRHVERLADPQETWTRWQEVFDGLDNRDGRLGGIAGTSRLAAVPA